MPGDMNDLAAEQPIDIFRLTAVAAEQPVVAKMIRSPGFVIASSGGSGTSSSVTAICCPAWASLASVEKRRQRFAVGLDVLQ